MPDIQTKKKIRFKIKVGCIALTYCCVVDNFDFFPCRPTITANQDITVCKLKASGEAVRRQVDKQETAGKQEMEDKRETAIEQAQGPSRSWCKGQARLMKAARQVIVTKQINVVRRQACVLSPCFHAEIY